MANVRILQATAVLSGLRFGMGVWVLYYLRLTDYAGIGLAETVTIVTSFAMEVPTGVAADRWGRKRCLVASFTLELVGYALLAAAPDLAWLLLSLFVLQLGKALQSGAFEAMLWESLHEQGRERDYVRALGRVSGARLVAGAGAGLAGGFLYPIDPRLPFALAAAAFGAAALLALGLREPERLARTSSGGSFAGAAVLLARAWQLSVPLLLVGAYLAVTEEVLDDVLSVEFGFAPSGLGALLAAAYLGAAAAAHAAHRLEHRFGRRRLVFGMAIIAATTLAISPRLGMIAGGSTVLLRYALRSVHDTVVTGQLASAAAPGQRATAISLYQAARRLPYVALAWSVGMVMDQMTARGFALYFGLAMAATTFVAWRLSVAGSRGQVAPPPAPAGAERW
jgi:predicted MFS family arabinose efflux permease